MDTDFSPMPLQVLSLCTIDDSLSLNNSECNWDATWCHFESSHCIVPPFSYPNALMAEHCLLSLG